MWKKMTKLFSECEKYSILLEDENGICTSAVVLRLSSFDQELAHGRGFTSHKYRKVVAT